MPLGTWTVSILKLRHVGIASMGDVISLRIKTCDSLILRPPPRPHPHTHCLEREPRALREETVKTQNV